MKSPTARLQSSDKKRSPSASGTTSVLSVLSLLESLTLAIVLALVFRGFVVEAFVIPTGSMAETLLGIHAEIICPECRQVYSTGIPEGPVSKPYCPNCGADVERGFALAGDRVLVLKPMYFLSRYKGLEWLGPKRWDVAVFLYPGNGQENYIKRITGLPGDSIEIIDGDIYIDGQIAHKPLRVQEELWIPVFDNDYQRQNDGLDGPAWQEVSSQIERLRHGRVLRLNAKGSERTLVYKGANNNGLAYNALGRVESAVTVSDLRLSFDVIARERGKASEVRAVLSKANRQFRLRLGFSEEEAVIELQSRDLSKTGEGQPYWKTMQDESGSKLRRELGVIAPGKSLALQLQNADYRVSIWVDGEEVLATADSNYSPGALGELRAAAQGSSTKPYVAIGAKDCEIDLLHIKLDRDVYYTSSGRMHVPRKERWRADAVSAKLEGDPARGFGKPFQIPPGKKHPGPAYFLMGDNSSNSYDSRLWSLKHDGLGDDYARGTVPRSHLIGQAFSGYWIPELSRKPQLIPRASKVRFIR